MGESQSRERGVEEKARIVGGEWCMLRASKAERRPMTCQ